MNMIRRSVVGFLVGMMAFPCSPVSAQMVMPAASLARLKQIDIAWCYGASVERSKLRETIIAEAARLPEASRAAATALPEADFSPEDYFLVRRQLILLDGAAMDDQLKARIAAAAIDWLATPKEPEARLAAYIERTTKPQEGRPDCPALYQSAVQHIETDSKAKLKPVQVSADLFTAIRSLPSDDLSLAESGQLVSLLFSDGQLSKDDQSILHQLVLSDGVTIEDAANSRTLHIQDRKSAIALSLMSGSLDMADVWMVTPELTEAYAQIASATPKTEEAFRGFVARKLLAIWQASNEGNDYAPFKAAIGDVEQVAGLIDDANAAQSVRSLAYRAAKMVDEYAKGSVPDLLYSGLNR